MFGSEFQKAAQSDTVAVGESCCIKVEDADVKIVLQYQRDAADHGVAVYGITLKSPSEVLLEVKTECSDILIAVENPKIENDFESVCVEAVRGSKEFVISLPKE